MESRPTSIPESLSDKRQQPATEHSEKTADHKQRPFTPYRAQCEVHDPQDNRLQS